MRRDDKCEAIEKNNCSAYALDKFDGIAQIFHRKNNYLHECSLEAVIWKSYGSLKISGGNIELQVLLVVLLVEKCIANILAPCYA